MKQKAPNPSEFLSPVFVFFHLKQMFEWVNY